MFGPTDSGTWAGTPSNISIPSPKFDSRRGGAGGGEATETPLQIREPTLFPRGSRVPAKLPYSGDRSFHHVKQTPPSAADVYGVNIVEKEMTGSLPTNIASVERLEDQFPQFDPFALAVKGAIVRG